jgi:hypothetical protein
VDGKDPVIAGGFKKRSTDIEQVNAWWSESDYNIGICPADMGLIAVDLDLTKTLGVSRALLDMLPATRTHQTPSGGEHRLYLSFEAFSNRGLGVNADIRSANGYILWPPSRINGAEYRVIDTREPEILPESIRAHLGRKLEDPETCQVPDDGIDKMLPEAREWAARYAENQSHDRFVAAGALVRNFGLTNMTATEIAHEFGIRTQSDSPEGTTWAQTLDNARKHGQGELGTGVAWQPPPGRDDVPPEIDAAAAALYAARKAEAKGRYNRRTPEEAAKRPPLTYWDGKKLLPKGIPVAGFIYGKRGAHKTGLILKLGLDAIGLGAKVLYLAQEGAYGFEVARLPRTREARDIPWETINSHWRTEPEKFNLMRREDHEALAECYKDFAPDMIFIDVLGRVVTGIDINSPEGGQKVIEEAYALAERFNCLVLIVAHPGKDDSKGMLGSSLLDSLTDVVLKVSAKGNKIFVYVDKMKDGEAERTEVFAVDKSRGVPVIIDAPPEPQPKVGEVESGLTNAFVSAVTKFLEANRPPKQGWPMPEFVDQLLTNCVVEGKPNSISKRLRENGGRGHFRGYYAVEGKGEGGNNNLWVWGKI